MIFMRFIVFHMLAPHIQHMQHMQQYIHQYIHQWYGLHRGGGGLRPPPPPLVADRSGVYIGAYIGVYIGVCIAAYAAYAVYGAHAAYAVYGAQGIHRNPYIAYFPFRFLAKYAAFLRSAKYIFLYRCLKRARKFQIIVFYQVKT